MILGIGKREILGVVVPVMAKSVKAHSKEHLLFVMSVVLGQDLYQAHICGVVTGGRPEVCFQETSESYGKDLFSGFSDISSPIVQAVLLGTLRDDG